MNQPPKEVEEWRNKCLAAGFIKDQYAPPYKIRDFSTMQKNFWDFSWERGEHPCDKGDVDAMMGRPKQPAYCVEIHFTNEYGQKDSQREGGFTLDRTTAKKWEKLLNIRHFKTIFESGGKVFL